MKWREIPVPARKADYEGKCLRLLEDPPRYEIPRSLWPDGYAGSPDLTDMIVYVQRRMNAKDTMGSSTDVSSWGSVRVLRFVWDCPYCATGHTAFIPESWIAEGKAIFMEKCKD
jgi:hypothetical protein